MSRILDLPLQDDVGKSKLKLRLRVEKPTILLNCSFDLTTCSTYIFDFQAKLKLEMSSQRDKQQFQKDLDAKDDEMEQMRSDQQRKV